MRAASLTRFVIAAAVAGSTLALPAESAAQFRDRDRDERGWNNRGGSEGFQRGFADGQRLGEEDARRNRAFNLQNHREYREADAGYRRANGSRDLYRDEFRRGFTEGYRLGFRDDRWDRRDDRNGRDRNRDGNFRDPGQARGFSDGYRKGVEDRRDNHRFEPNRFKEVRQGTAPGYEGNFGSRDRYTDRYRDGFRDGYEDGFRSGYARR